MIVGTKAEFERLADFILRDYLGNAYDGYDPLDIQAFAKDYLKLDISYFAFDPDTGIEGMRTGNQIILDDRLLDDKKAGERNFTIAHECGHDLINWQDPSYSPQTVVNYRIKSSGKSLVTEDDFKEWQANVVDKYEDLQGHFSAFCNRCGQVAVYNAADYEASLESMRNAFSTDPVRMKLSQFKYESGLIPDDEILAFVLFLVADSNLVEYASAIGEVEFDDLAVLLNHMANRAKFLLMCLREGRFDILNAVVQFARKYKSEQIDTIFCFDKVEPDDGGLADYYKAMTDHGAFAALNDDPAEDDFDDSEEYDDKLDEYDRDEEEPAVERDFEG